MSSFLLPYFIDFKGEEDRNFLTFTFLSPSPSLFYIQLRLCRPWPSIVDTSRKRTKRVSYGDGYDEADDYDIDDSLQENSKKLVLICKF